MRAVNVWCACLLDRLTERWLEMSAPNLPSLCFCVCACVCQKQLLLAEFWIEPLSLMCWHFLNTCLLCLHTIRFFMASWDACLSSG